MAILHFILFSRFSEELENFISLHNVAETTEQINLSGYNNEGLHKYCVVRLAHNVGNFLAFVLKIYYIDVY